MQPEKMMSDEAARVKECLLKIPRFDFTNCSTEGKRKKFSADVSEYMQNVLEELDDGKYFELLQSDFDNMVKKNMILCAYHEWAYRVFMQYAYTNLNFYTTKKGFRNRINNLRWWKKRRSTKPVLESEEVLTGDPVEMERSEDPIEWERTEDPLEMKRTGDPLELERTGDTIKIERTGDLLELERAGDPLEIEDSEDTFNRKNEIAQVEHARISAEFSAIPRFDYKSMSSEGKQKRFSPDVHEFMKQVVEELDDGKFSKLLKSDTQTKVKNTMILCAYYNWAYHVFMQHAYTNLNFYTTKKGFRSRINTNARSEFCGPVKENQDRSCGGVDMELLQAGHADLAENRINEIQVEDEPASISAQYSSSPQLDIEIKEEYSRIITAMEETPKFDYVNSSREGKRLRYFDPDVHEYMQRVVNELDGGKFADLLNSDLNTKLKKNMILCAYYNWAYHVFMQHAYTNLNFYTTRKGFRSRMSNQKSEFCLSKKREAQIGTPRRLKADIPLESRCADPLESRFADPLKVESSVEEEDRVKKEHELQEVNIEDDPLKKMIKIMLEIILASLSLAEDEVSKANR